MQDLLKSLYRVYCERKGQYDLPPEAKHLLLIVEDAHNMVTEQSAERSFICGFRLAAALAMELMMDTEE